MSTMILHIKTWMQKSIAEVEDLIAKQVAKHVEQQIQGVHKFLVPFELRVLGCLLPTIDLTVINDELDSLRDDVDAIFEMQRTETESAPTS